MKLSVVILAAGQGSRMCSSTPKVLHKIAGKPMLAHVIETARQLNAAQIVIVYGHAGEQVQAAFADDQDLIWVEQKQQKGTGHALQQALPWLQKNHVCLVLYGDVPLIQAETLVQLTQRCASSALALLSVQLNDPTGYGRIVKNAEGQVIAIVEEKDASESQKQICEVNTGIMAIPGQKLAHWLEQIENCNAQSEYYLTDLVAIAYSEGCVVNTQAAEAAMAVAGINDKHQLARVERYYQRRLADQLMISGTTLHDPDRIDIRGQLTVGSDVEIDIDVIFKGKVVLGDRVTIESHCIIENATIAAGSIVKSHSVIEGAIIAPSCHVGPYARIRPGTELHAQAKVGNFVEIKKSKIATGSKVNHLSYIGDADIGKYVNIGAGTITCNYDGVNKHKTVIEDNAFIGSGVNLIAPVVVGAGATIGAGSTVAKDAPKEQLTLSRSRQTTVPGWIRATKKTQEPID